MTSSRERQQRATARARLARQMAERQAAARRRRQRIIAASAAAGLVLVVAGGFWVVSAVTGDEGSPAAASASPTPSANGSPAAGEPGECLWNDAAASETLVDVGTPPEGEPREGTQVMTVTTNLGEIQVEMDLAAAPCIAASFTHLAGQEFYDGSYCHRMFPGMLQCGDPNAVDAGYQEQAGIGSGGPTYQYPDQNLPATPNPVYYPAGTVAMANSGPGTNGSQFFFIYQDTDLNGPNYSVVGQVVEGMDVLEQVDEIGHDGAFDPQPGGGHPNQDIIIESLRVADPS